MRFGELVKKHRPELVISRRYDAWVAKNDNPYYSDEAIEFCRQQLLAQRTPRDRKGSVSASSAGKCLRRQQFTFIGLPEPDYSAKTSSIFINGTFMHLRWQMAGLTEGWLAEAEVPVPENDLRLSGTMDGIADEGSVVEFKSANSYSFSRAMTYGPLYGHEEQGGTYLLATGRERVIFIYENKDTQEYVEIVKHRDDLPLLTIQIRLQKLWESIDRKELAPVLDTIYEMKMPCSSCQFKDVCPSITSWQQAEEMAEKGA